MSEESFAANARRLCGQVARLLGWSPAEFWSATPAELAAIVFAENEPTATPLGRAELNALMERDANG